MPVRLGLHTQFNHTFAANWEDGTTSSSDGQSFRAGGRGESTGHVNPKYGNEPGRLVTLETLPAIPI